MDDCYRCGQPIKDNEGYRHVSPDSRYLEHKYCPDEGDDEEEDA